MRILITGVAGFLGSNFAKYHLEQGDRVFGIDNLSSKNSNQLLFLLQQPKFHFIENDLRTWPDKENILSNMDLIYHFAAILGVFRVCKQPELVLNNNMFATYHLLEKIRQNAPNARIFLASSSEIYGQQDVEKLHENLNSCIPLKLKHRMNYPVSKLVDECYGLTYYHKYGLKITILRIFNIIGHGQIGQYGMVVPRFIEAAKNNQPLTIFGNGEQSRSFCDIRDCIGYLQALINCQESIGEIINIGNDQPIKIIDLAKMVVHLSRSHSIFSYLSFEEAYQQTEEYMKFRCPDLTRLHSMVSYRCQWTLADTLRDLIHDKN